MSAIYNFLFPLRPDGKAYSLLLLAFRLLFGLLLMAHGMQKLMDYSALSSVFPDPFGIGSKISLILAIFAELICSIGFVLGAFYRLALIPMTFTMATAMFVIHGHDSFAIKELPFIYLAVFIIMYIAGAGRYSLDRFIALALEKEKKE